MAERNSFDDFTLCRSWSIHVQRYRFASGFAEGRRVIDAGCGIGYGAFELLRSGAQSVDAIDYSEEALAEARRLYPDERISWMRGDLHDLPACWNGRGHRDLLVHLENLEHLAEPRRFYRDVVGILHPSSPTDVACVVSTPNGDITDRDAEGNIRNPFHVFEFTPAQFTEFLEDFFEKIELYAQWQTPAGRAREERDRRIFEDVSACYWNPACRIGRMALRLAGRSVPVPPVYTGAAETYDGEHTIARLSDRPFPWPPMYLLACCRGVLHSSGADGTSS